MERTAPTSAPSRVVIHGRSRTPISRMTTADGVAAEADDIAIPNRTRVNGATRTDGSSAMNERCALARPLRDAAQARRGGPRLVAVAGPQTSRVVPTNDVAGSDAVVACGISMVADRNGAEKETARQRSHSSTGS